MRDGIADVVWTLPGYTRGRFPVIEAFELPFMISTAEATSQAVQEYYETYAREEFSSIHPLMFHVHARGVILDRELLVVEALQRQLDAFGHLSATPGLARDLKRLGPSVARQRLGVPQASGKPQGAAG